MKRRIFVQAGVASPLALVANSGFAQVQGQNSKTYVLVHGTFLGGWFWRPVADQLRSQGHRVFTPTQTGTGERKHLLSRDITLDTFILDIVNLIEAEELTNVILVGHSSAGISITGVADRIPDRLHHVVYLDAILAESGQSNLDAAPPEMRDARRKAVLEVNGVRVAPPPSGGPPQNDPTADWVRRRLTAYPFDQFENKLTLEHPLGNGLPCTYVAFTKAPAPFLEPSRALARKQKDWNWMELPVNHPAPAFAPNDVVQLLSSIG